jgi:hypothetical protein
LAALESLDSPWPNQPPKERGYQFRGYRLDQQGRPTFEYSGPGFAVEDQPVPAAGKKDAGFERRLTIRAEPAAAQLYFLAAVSPEIKPLGEGRYLVGGTLQIRVRSAGPTPIVRQNGGRQELLVPLAMKEGKAEMVQEIVW